MAAPVCVYIRQRSVTPVKELDDRLLDILTDIRIIMDLMTISRIQLCGDIMTGIDQAAVGNFFSVIMAQNGEVYTCGRTNFGQCGNGTKNGTAK